MSTNMVELEPELMAIVEKLDGLTLIQASKVVKHLEARWGVSAAAPVAVAAAPAGGAAWRRVSTTLTFQGALVAPVGRCPHVPWADEVHP